MMNTDISIADIVVHLHPDTTAECKGRIDDGLWAQEGVAIAARMDMKFAAVVPITRQMQYDMDLITQQMLNVTGPMNFMTDMMPMGN
jgi:hypothetical protein